ncbi:hypothetical protein TNCV_2522491 [Trichonephila clavipes]|nr:hypothetical protein TNCV_2522491 [Trichonephila clavipes]
MYDHTGHAMFKSSSLPIRLNCFLSLLVLLINRTTTDPGYIRSTLALCGSRMDFCTPEIHRKLVRFYAEACGNGYGQQ